MRSYWMQTDGGQTVLQTRDLPLPQPGSQQLLVRMHAAALNRGEFIVGHGLHKAGEAKAIGMEGAGEVVQAIAGSRFQAGDRVMGRCGGAFSEFALMDEREAVAVPPGLSWEQAASVPLVFLVVHDMLLQQGRLAAGEWMLVNGVSSGVGVAALQLAKAIGARVIGTSGSADKLARLQPFGLDLGLPTRGADFHEAVLQATDGKGVNLVINTVGGSVFAEDLRCMAFEGRLATVGYVDGVLDARIDLQALHAKRLTLFGVSNKLRTPQQRASGVPGFIRDVLPALADGRIRPLVDRVFPFEQLAEGKACMDANQHVGKLVLAMPAA
ncbi:MAG: Alcohol dehydrogenase, zinc-binding protein [Ramlibacter sp.]|nr:Alcohol dehydrogenase, zinc-binding protein [Ramlibacter sp.]